MTVGPPKPAPCLAAPEAAAAAAKRQMAEDGADLRESQVPRRPIPAARQASAAATSDDATRIDIFTSGTTGNPKGVQLSYKAYRCNKKTFESFLDCGESKRLIAIVVNPMHHTNSTAITDWCLRTPRATLHLIQLSLIHI